MPSAHKPLFDLITIGESLHDSFYFLHDASVSCTINKNTCLLCLEYAEKIPVQQVISVPAAGNSSNAAVGASRLGLNTAFVTWIGKDVAGQSIQKALALEGVDSRYVVEDPKTTTNESTIINFQGEKTQLICFQRRKYKLPKLAPTHAIYYSALGEQNATCDKLLLRELNKQPKTRLIFQPGTTHVRHGLKGITPLIKKSWVFILNKEEAHQLLGDGDRTVCNLMEVFHRMGAKIVVITDGPKGADAWDGSRHWHMPIFDGKSKERTGAGDSFATALSVALLKGLALPDALRWGAANSWSVVQQVGPQAGLLTTAGMSHVLKKFTKTKATLHSH